MQPFQHNKNSQEKSISSKETCPQIVSNQNSLHKPSFSPFLTNSLTCSDSGSVFYNQRRNLIINAANSAIVLYDAVTLKEIKSRELDNWVLSMSYCDEIDTYIVGCNKGFFYSYNAPKDELKQLKKRESDVWSVEFLGSKFYAFLLSGSKEVHIGNFEDEDVVSFGWHNIKPNGLHYLAKSKLSLVSFDNGSVKIFNTKNLPHIKEVCTVQAHRNIFVLQSFEINGKEYVITVGKDETLKIWHLLKGKMRLLKVIRTSTKANNECSVVYLENYKMIAISYSSRYIDFFNIPSGRIKMAFPLTRWAQSLFLMKDKNMLGCVGMSDVMAKTVHFLQLHRRKETSS